MRHDYHGQVRQNRALAEQLAASTEQIRLIEQRFCAGALPTPAGETTLDDSSNQLIQHLIDFDIQLSRAIDAVVADVNGQHRLRAATERRLHAAVARLSPVARWFARRLVALIEEDATETETETNSAHIADGLAIVLAKLRAVLQDHSIERIETTGQPFDGQTMESIGTVESTTVAPGHVTHEISPIYRHGVKILRFAQVRVARGPDFIGVARTHVKTKLTRRS